MASLAGALRRLLRRPSRKPAVHPFDTRHGVDTAGLLYARALASGHAHHRYNEGYYGTAPSLFRGLMALWQSTLAAGCGLSGYSFIDLGCGKGRVLMLASEFPFRSIAGIELDANLTRTARRNLKKWLRSPRACRHLAVEHADVLALELPPGPVLLYLFNAFHAEVLAALLNRLAAAARSRSAPIDLLYVHPDHDALVRRTPEIEFLADAEIPFSPEDAAADVFGVCSDRCIVYRLRGDLAR